LLTGQTAVVTGGAPGLGYAIAERFIAQTPLGRIAEGDDVAAVVSFLASPEARWITGVSLPVDGGLSLREHPELLEKPAAPS